MEIKNVGVIRPSETENSIKTNCLKKRLRAGILSFLILSLINSWPPSFFNGLASAADRAEQPLEIPAKGMVTMIDLGAKKCVPCKMMAPILEKLEKSYRGRAVIHFYDVWENPEPARRFGIRGIPTQIFFDKDAKEVYRHMGFMSEEDIVKQLAQMGVE